MSLDVVAVHVALGVGMFFVLNWVGRHSAKLGYLSLNVFLQADESPAFNFVYRAIGPIVLLILAAAALYALHLDYLVRDIWHVLLYYFGGRLAFNIAVGRARLVNWPRELVLTSVSVAIGWSLYDAFLSARRLLLPDVETMTNEFWLLVILFVYSTLNSLRFGNERTRARKDAYLANAYASARGKYQSIIESNVPDRFCESIVYSILLLEAFNRPTVARFMERVVHPWGSRSLGIMQVQTDTIISDEESVRRGSTKIAQAYDRVVAHARSVAARSGKEFDPAGRRYHRMYVLHHVAADYNRDDSYVSAVGDMHDTVVDRFYPEFRLSREAYPHYTERFLEL